MPEKKTQVKISGSTDMGMRRRYNQDFIGFNQDLGIAVLADGMGGHKAGEVAAQIAVATVLENFQKVSDQRTAGSLLLDYVSNTISNSNAKIYQASETDGGPKRMGTTVVAVIVKGPQVYVGHVGDSRLYLYRERALRRITKDHSLAQDLIDKDFYTEAGARKANVGHVVTRALGIKVKVQVDTIQQELKLHDVLLLCSDGLTDMVSDWQIAEVITENAGDLDSTTAKLVDLANKHGGKDNISVILIQIVK